MVKLLIVFISKTNIDILQLTYSKPIANMPSFLCEFKVNHGLPHFWEIFH